MRRAVFEDSCTQKKIPALAGISLSGNQKLNNRQKFTSLILLVATYCVEWFRASAALLQSSPTVRT